MKWNLRNALSFIIARVILFSGLVEKAKKSAFRGDQIISIYCHNPARHEFETLVKWLVKQKFNFISLDTLQEIIAHQHPFPKGAVLITVDDGWHSNIKNVVEVAEIYKIPVTIFVSTEPVEKGVFWWSYVLKAAKKKMGFPSVAQLKEVPNPYRVKVLKNIKETLDLPREAMTIPQIQKIAQSPYVTIGCHTHTHPILSNCDKEQLEFELWHSREKLESWINSSVSTFSYPNGDFGIREISTLKQLGFDLGFANDPRKLTPELIKEKYSIPRNGLLEGASLAENICRAMGVWKIKDLMFPLKSLKNKIPHRQLNSTRGNGIQLKEFPASNSK